MRTLWFVLCLRLDGTLPGFDSDPLKRRLRRSLLLRHPQVSREIESRGYREGKGGFTAKDGEGVEVLYGKEPYLTPSCLHFQAAERFWSLTSTFNHKLAVAMK